MLTKLIGFIRKEDNLFRGEKNSFHEFIPYLVDTFILMNTNTMATINNFKIILKLNKGYPEFCRQNNRIFYNIEGIVLIILDSLTKMKLSERDILTTGFLERLLNLLGQFVMDELLLSHDLVTLYVNLYYGVMDTQELVASDTVKFIPNLLIFCGMASDRDVGTRSSLVAQRLIKSMQVNSKHEVFKDLINIDQLDGFKHVSIPKSKWYQMFFSIIVENMQIDLTERARIGDSLKSTEEILSMIRPMYFDSIDNGKIELSTTFLGFYRMVVNLLNISNPVTQHLCSKNMMRDFRNVGLQSEEKIGVVEATLGEDQAHELEILKFNLKNLDADLATF